MQKVILYLLSFLASVFGNRYNLNGATFLEDINISVGYAQWIVISGLDTEYIEDDFINLNEMKKKLFKYIKEYATLNTEVDFSESFWKLQISALEAAEKKAKNKFKDLNIYLGKSKRKHGKRSVATAIAGTVELAAKIGASIYDIHNANQKSDKVDQFIERYNLNLRHLNSTVQDLVSYKEDQVSFSRTALNNLLQLKERFTSLDEEFEKLNYGITSKLTLQYHFSFLTEAFNQLTKFQDIAQTGLIKASKGIPTTPFLSPNKVLSIMTDYQEDPNAEKSYFSRNQVLEVYNLASSRLEKDDNEVAVVTSVKLPTVNTKARLFKIVTYPEFNPEKNVFVTVKTNFPYIAINSDSKYMLLTSSDVNSCQDSQSILLCESTDKMVWTDRNIPSCESALWFQDQELMEELCDYDVEAGDDEARVTYVDNGVYHYSVAHELSVPLECLTEEGQTSENLSILQNGFIVIAPTCSASIQGTLIKNLLTQNVERYEIVPDLSFHDITRISQIKNETLREAAEESEFHESLNNKDILENILDEAKHTKHSIIIKSLFEKYELTANQSATTKLNYELATQNRLDNLLNNNVEAISGFKALDIAIITLAILVSVVFVAAFFFLQWFLKMKSASLSNAQAAN